MVWERSRSVILASGKDIRCKDTRTYSHPAIVIANAHNRKKLFINRLLPLRLNCNLDQSSYRQLSGVFSSCQVQLFFIVLFSAYHARDTPRQRLNRTNLRLLIYYQCEQTPTYAELHADVRAPSFFKASLSWHQHQPLT